MTQNSKWMTENILWTLTYEPKQTININFKIHIFIFPTICSISPFSVCSVANPFKKSFQIVRYNTHMLPCHITFKYQKYRMFIINLRSF